MYPPDRSQIQSERQTKSLDLAFLEKLSIPAVIRNNDRKFSMCNGLFFDEIMKSTSSSADEWFSTLPLHKAIFLSSTELNAMSSSVSELTISRIEINEKIWFVQFLPLTDSNDKKVLWLFYPGSINGNYVYDCCLNSRLGYEKILSFKKKATKIQWKVFLLYVYGFKHSSISEFLLIENGVSRNIVLEINKFFNVGSKHSLQVLFYNSKFSDDYLIDLRKIISDTN